MGGVFAFVEGAVQESRDCVGHSSDLYILGSWGDVFEQDHFWTHSRQRICDALGRIKLGVASIGKEQVFDHDASVDCHPQLYRTGYFYDRAGFPEEKQNMV